MRIVRFFAAAALILLPTVIVSESAQALTAKQYQHQGRGQYITSKGRPVRTMHHYRHGRPHGYRR